MSKKTTKRKSSPRTRKGMLPDQGRRVSTVSLEVMRNQSHVDQETGGHMDKYGVMDFLTWQHFIISTQIIDSKHTVWVELNGNAFEIPGKVFQQMVRHKDSITSELRSERARERFAAKARADQHDAERERQTDLAGL